MSGGATTVDLVAESSKAGALGSLGAAYMTPSQIVDAARAIKERTNRPFMINIFAPLPEPGTFDAAPMLRRMGGFHKELGLPVPELPDGAASQEKLFYEQLDAVFETGVPIFSFTFGIPPKDAMQRLKKAGMVIIGTATNVEEARMVEAAGCDAIIAQGSEAGGHRGTFNGPHETGMIGTLALVPQIAGVVSIPVIAAGGIMDGRGIVASLALGAEAAALGTAFLVSDESGIPDAHKARIVAAHDDDIVMTRAFSGRHARGIANRFVREVEASPDEILPYPVQNKLTRAMRTAAGAQGNAEFLSLWSGQAPRLARPMSVAGLVRLLVEETRAELRKINAIEI